MTAEIAKAVVDHRTDPKYGPFQGVQDFQTFLQQQGVNVQTFNIDPTTKNPVINILFDSEINFRIKSTGIYGKAEREIVAVVYDFDKVKSQLSAMVVASVTPTPPGTRLTTTAATPSPFTASPAARSRPAVGPPWLLIGRNFKSCAPWIQEALIARTVGIDIGSFSIKVAELEGQLKSTTVRDFYEIPLSHDPGQDQRLEKLEALKKIAANYDPTRYNIVVGLGSEFSTSRIVNFPFLERRKILQSLPFRTGRRYSIRARRRHF